MPNRLTLIFFALVCCAAVGSMTELVLAPDLRPGASGLRSLASAIGLGARSPGGADQARARVERSRLSTDLVSDDRRVRGSEIKEASPLNSIMVAKADQIEAQSRQLLENWDLTGSGLKPDELLPYLDSSQPESIVIYSGGGMKQVRPLHVAPEGLQDNKVLYLADGKAIDSVKEEREEDFSDNALAAPALPAPEKLTALPENAYEIVSFRPGLRDNGDTMIPVVTNALAAIQGPDYSLINFDSGDDQLMLKNLSTVWTLGHGGEILLKVSQSGFVQDDAGADFVLYENPFRQKGIRYVYQEFGYVGVSNTADPSSFKWYPCDPTHGVLKGCIGVVPAAEGGDRFDLADVGLKQIKYIWIKDLGNNKNNFHSKWPTEGVDLDAMRFLHAYRSP